MKKRIALLALALTLCGAFAAFPVSAHEEETGAQNKTVISADEKMDEEDEGYRPMTIDPSTNKGYKINGIDGITCVSSLRAPEIFPTVSSDPVLSGRYDAEPGKIMTLSLPCYPFVPRAVRVDLGNNDVLSLIGSNTVENIAGSSGSRIYVYSISNNSYDVLARSS